MRILALSLSLAWALVALPASGFEIVFDYRYDESGFFADPERRAALERAARQYTVQLDDHLPAMPASTWPGWVALFANPENGELVRLEEISVPEDVLLVFVGARSLLEKNGKLAAGGPGEAGIGFKKPGCRDRFECWMTPSRIQGTWPSSETAFRYLFRSTPGARMYPATDFSTWGGALAFASDAPWYFGESHQVPADRFDFFSVAVHELGHLLGVGVAESWGAQTSGMEFHGAEVMRMHGGPVALADHGHWHDDMKSYARSVPQKTAFTARIARGERRELTELDLAALRDVGWKPTSVAAHTGIESAYLGQRIKGDVDGNGAINVHDYLRLADHIFEVEDLGADFDVESADVAADDGIVPMRDGVVDDRDLEWIAAAAAWGHNFEKGTEFLHMGFAEMLEFLGIRHELLVRFGDVEIRRAFAMLGWMLPDDPRNPTPGHLYQEGRVWGDVDGDGRLTFGDEMLLKRYLHGKRLSDPRAIQAADVAPRNVDGSLGDGKLDDLDREHLLRALSVEDFDGDGVSNFVENYLNKIWMKIIGRPRFQPLMSWSEVCLPQAQRPGVDQTKTKQGAFFVNQRPQAYLQAERLVVLSFCRRDGTPWSFAGDLFPEEAPPADPPDPSLLSVGPELPPPFESEEAIELPPVDVGPILEPEPELATPSQPKPTLEPAPPAPGPVPSLQPAPPQSESVAPSKPQSHRQLDGTPETVMHGDVMQPEAIDVPIAAVSRVWLLPEGSASDEEEGEREASQAWIGELLGGIVRSFNGVVSVLERLGR